VEGRGGKHYRSKKMNAQRSTHVYEVRPRKDHRGVDLISDVLPFGRLWYGEPDAITMQTSEKMIFGQTDYLRQ
jgi:hypothetical protein